MLVPKIKPDGVANGHYRMDTLNQNLNRYYKNPDVKKQPAIFAIKELVKYLNRLSDLLFVLARVANQANGVAHVEWRKSKK